VQYYFFHLMSWPYLPDDFEQRYDSAWVWLSNTLYDPVKGHDLYREYLNTLAYADELGFDGICVNEHHQNAYGLMPSPNVIAGALTQRTRRCKIAVIGNALPLYNPPLRVAEEFAMLDVMSGGRLIAGMVIGGGPEYFSYQVNPTNARERFREALDLILKKRDHAVTLADAGPEASYVAGGSVLIVSRAISDSTYITSLYFGFFVPVDAHSGRWSLAPRAARRSQRGPLKR